MPFLSALSVFLGLDSAQFQKGLDDATKKSKQFEREQARIAKEGAQNFKNFALGVAGAATALATLAVAAFRQADEIVDLANAYDSSVESVLALNQAFIVSGGNAETAGKALAKLAQNAEGAREGNVKLRQAFADVGISAAEVQNLNPDQLLLRVAESLKDIEDPTKRNAKAFELLGKAAKGIDWESVADQYDRVADPEKAKAIEEGAKAWDNLQIALKNIFGVVIKLLQPFANLVNYVATFTDRFRKLKEEGATFEVMDEFGMVHTVDYKADEKAASERAKKIEEGKKARDKQRMEAEAKGGYKIEDAEQAAVRAANEQTRIQQNQFLVEKQRLALARDRVNLDEYQARVAEEQLNSQAKILALEEQITKVSSQIKYGNEQAKASKLIEISNLQKQIDYEKQLSTIRLEQIETDKMRAESFQFGWEQAFKKYAEDAQKSSKLGEEYFRTFTNTINSAIDEFVEKGKISFKSLFATFIKELLKAELKAQASKLFTAGGGIGGLFGSLAGLGKGFIGMAEGGPVTGGAPYMVGEQGPEMFIPNANGMVVPNNQLGAMGGTQNVTNYYINAIDTQSFNQALARNKEGVRGAYDSASRGRPTSR